LKCDREPSPDTIKDIAEYIGVYYTTVSRVIKKIEGEDEK
jgi:DNA-binding MarR family transcriptional regulator